MSYDYPMYFHEIEEDQVSLTGTGDAWLKHTIFWYELLHFQTVHNLINVNMLSMTMVRTAHAYYKIEKLYTLTYIFCF